VVGTLYLSPVVLVLTYLVIAFFERPVHIHIRLLARLIGMAAAVFLIREWIRIAKSLRDIKPGVVQETKKWLMISLGGTILSAALSLIGERDADTVFLGALKILAGVAGFVIWFSYFNRSRRIKATYRDWNS